MSLWGKISLSISGFCVVVMSGASFILGGWDPLLYGFLALFLLGIIASAVLDYKLYLKFLSIKTAKKGLGLGWSLLILIIFLTATAYLGSRFNKTLDLTEEGINSLSEQTTDILKNLDSELVFLIFYKGDKISPEITTVKQELKNNLQLYKQYNSKLKVVFIDTYKNNLKAEEYLSSLPDKNQQGLFVFVNYKNRKIRADAPFSEESLTAALIKAQKREFKDILFLTGHGERDLNSESPDGLKILKQSLEDSGFNPRKWNFLQEGAPSPSPALVISLGPSQPFLEAEKAWLKDYLSKGGKLFLSLDPKENHNLQEWLKNYGILFENNFILSQLGLFYGSPAKAIGTLFDNKNSITKRFHGKQTAVLFEKASSIDVLPSAFEQFQVSYLVKSHSKSFTAPQLTNKVKMGKLSSLNMALEIQPKTKETSLPEEDKDQETKKENFRLAVFGDSDFLTNRYIHEGANRDLALNTFVSLTGEEELISIRPKQPKGTKITLNRPQRTSLILLYISLPITFLLIGLWLWFKRRES